MPDTFTQYHGTPITPAALLETLHGASFCVSYAAPEQVQRCHEIGARVMLDNGAFSFWMAGKATDWPGFYAWAGEWLARCPSTWAVIPDVIGGSCAENDALIDAWPLERDRGAPVWHVHEPIARLVQLAGDWPRVCIGSSGEYRDPGSPAWTARMDTAFNALLPDGGPPPCELHMLRGMRFSSWHYPFASVDSTDVARNHNRHRRDVAGMVARWSRSRPPATWSPRLTLNFA
jgi:hypothetical protein